MIRADGVVKLVDFGLARMSEAGSSGANWAQPTEARTVMGTPRYMSPEQAQGLQADGRADIFSLGAVFYEMLSAGLRLRGIRRPRSSRDPLRGRRAPRRSSADGLGCDSS